MLLGVLGCSVVVVVGPPCGRCRGRGMVAGGVVPAEATLVRPGLRAPWRHHVCAGLVLRGYAHGSAVRAQGDRRLKPVAKPTSGKTGLRTGRRAGKWQMSRGFSL
jgi:hypothetical protein